MPDDYCDCCGRPAAELPAGPGDVRLMKTWRGPDGIHAFLECRQCIGLTDLEAYAKRAVRWLKARIGS